MRTILLMGLAAGVGAVTIIMTTTRIQGEEEVLWLGTVLVNYTCGAWWSRGCWKPKFVPHLMYYAGHTKDTSKLQKRWVYSKASICSSYYSSCKSSLFHDDSALIVDTIYSKQRLAISAIHNTKINRMLICVISATAWTLDVIVLPQTNHMSINKYGGKVV